MRADVRIFPTTEFESFDFDAGRGPGDRCVGLRFDDLSLNIGLNGGDPEKVATIGALIDELDKLRDAAMARIRAQELAEINAASPAESHEVYREWTRGEQVTA